NNEIHVRSGGFDVAMVISIFFAFNLLHLGLAWLDLINARGFDARFIFAVRLIVWFGLLQFIYVLPLVFVLRKKGRSNVAKGMLIAATINFLLCAACWGSISFVTGEAPWKS